MKYLEKYTGEKTYMYPNGVLATPAKVLSDFESALTFTHVVETDANREVMFGFYNLSALRTQHNIDSSISEDEAIKAIEDILNAPTPEPEPDAQTQALENIAAQLEYQNMVSTDTTVTEG